MFFKHQYPIFVNSIPKSGTHLLLNIIRSLPNTRLCGDFSYSQRYHPDKRMEYILSNITLLNPGSIYSGHVPFTENFEKWLVENNFKQVFIYRDPRDIVISSYHFIMEMRKEKHPHYKVVKEFGVNEDRVIDFIVGIGDGKFDLVMNDQSLAAVRFMFQYYQQWLEHPSVLSIKFENLVKSPKTELIRILNFLNLNSDSEQQNIDEILSKGMNPERSSTFRQGKAESWRGNFNESRMNAFKDNFPIELLDKYGYRL